MKFDMNGFFNKPINTEQKRYEALRAFYIDKLSAKQVAEKFGFTTAYFKKLQYQYTAEIKKGHNPFFRKGMGYPELRVDRATCEGR